MNKYHIYTDGSCCGNPGPGGYGVVVLNEDETKLVIMEYDTNEQTTNNRMELTALIWAINYAIDHVKDGHSYIIHCDSAYCVNICNDWMWKWAKNSWRNSKKQIIENYDLVKEIYDLYDKEVFIHNFKVEKTDGHSGIIGNELADAAATRNWNKFEEIMLVNHIEEI